MARARFVGKPTSAFGERPQVRGASLEERAQIVVEVSAFREPPDRAERSAITNEIRHHRHVVATCEFVPVPEARERAGYLLVLEGAWRVEPRDLRRQPLANTEVPGLPGDHIAGSEQVGSQARHHARLGLRRRREVRRHAARQIEAASGRSANGRLDPDRARYFTPNFAPSTVRTVVPATCDAKLPGDSWNSSNTAAKAIDGCSNEAKPMNQPSGSPAGVSAVPLFPATATGNPRNGKYTVPSVSATTARIPSRISERSVGMLAARPSSAFSNFFWTAPDRSRISMTRRGFQTIPSLASAAAKFAICSGVARRKPCPIARLVASPGFHVLSVARWAFHAGLGTSPSASST